MSAVLVLLISIRLGPSQAYFSHWALVWNVALFRAYVKIYASVVGRKAVCDAQ